MVLFRKIPPWTVVLEVFSLLNISNEFPTTFQKSDLRSENFPACSGLLEPYYLPCKVKLYLEYTDGARIVTILRHILEVHGYCIKSLETTRNKKKAIFYTVERVAGDLRTAVSLDFS
jgi:hypothetical protein